MGLGVPVVRQVAQPPGADGQYVQGAPPIQTVVQPGAAAIALRGRGGGRAGEPAWWVAWARVLATV